MEKALFSTIQMHKELVAAGRVSPYSQLPYVIKFTIEYPELTLEHVKF